MVCICMLCGRSASLYTMLCTETQASAIITVLQQYACVVVHFTVKNINQCAGVHTYYKLVCTTLIMLLICKTDKIH
eukprot:15550-Heterococcus_DN1.PRE.8